MQCIAGFDTEGNGSGTDLVEAVVATVTPPENCVWLRSEPSALIFWIYAFVVPVFACFGLCANFINAIVFMRPKMTPSAFSYLSALSWLDCISCLLICLTAMSRSIFYNSTWWMTYDFQWQTPLFGITTGAANLILGSVSCDRLIYLWHGIPNAKGPPRFCRRKVARRIIAVVVLISVVVNFPYFFVFVVNDDGTFRTTKFYYSHYYKIHNWFTFCLLTLVPAIFLLIGNAAIIIAFRRWTKQSKLVRRHGSGSAKTTQKRYKHQMKLTVTILIVITLYMIGELPAHMTSRKSALNLIFGGDVTKVNFTVMERLEVICLTLNALQLSLNIMVYALINPSFMPEFFMCLRGASDVCFRICCLTWLINCCRGSNSNSKCAAKATRPKEARECAVVEDRAAGEAQTEPQSVKRRRRQREHSDSSDNSSNNWDTEPEDGSTGKGTHGVDFCLNLKSHRGTRAANRYGYHDETRISALVWSTQAALKRSNSLGDYAFDNVVLAISASELTHTATTTTPTPTLSKRHSVTV